MSRTRRFIHGVSVGYLLQAVTLLGGLWLTRFLLRQIGQDDYGTWLVALQVLAYLELIDLGVVSLLPREVAYATGAAAGPESRSAAAAPVLGKVRRIVLLQLPLVAVLGAGAWWGLDALSAADAGVVGLIVFVFVLQFPLRIYPAALQGLQDLAFLGWARTGLWLLQTGGIVLGVYAGLGMWALAIGWVVPQALLPLVSWVRLRFGFPGAISGEQAAPAERDVAGFLARGLWVTVGRVAQVLLNGSEILLVQYALGPAAVVVYVCSAKLVSILATQTYTLLLTAEPALSELRASGQSERMAQVSTALRELMLLLSGLMACVILATNEGFVTWWVGPEQYAGDALTLWLVGTMVARHLTFTLAHLLFCCGYERGLTCLGLLDGVVTVLGGWLLIPTLGLAGAPVGSCLGVLLLHLPACLYLLARDSRIPLSALVAAHLPWLWRFGALVVSLGLLGRVWKPTGLWSLAATAAGVCLAYLVVMIPALVHSPLWVYCQPRRARWWPMPDAETVTPPVDTLVESSS